MGERRDDEARKAERVTIEETRRRSGAGGIDTDAPSFAQETGTTDLGADEPRVNSQPDRQPDARPRN